MMGKIDNEIKRFHHTKMCLRVLMLFFVIEKMLREVVEIFVAIMNYTSVKLKVNALISKLKKIVLSERIRSQGFTSFFAGGLIHL
jgi:hypothetical protein